MGSNPRTNQPGQYILKRGFLERFSSQLNNQVRNSIWVCLAVAGIMLGGLILYSFAILSVGVWQYYALAGLTGVFVIVSLVGALLAARGRPVQAVWMMLVVGLIIIAINPLFISGLAIWYSLGIILSTLIISELCLQDHRQALANILGAIAAIAAMLIDNAIREFQTEPSSLMVNFLAILVFVLAGLYLLLISTKFSSYNLRSKIIITVFSAAILSIGVLSIANNVSTRRALINSVNHTLMLSASEIANDLDVYFQEKVAEVEQQAESLQMSIYLTLTEDERASNSTARTYLVTQRLISNAIFYALLDNQGSVVLHTAYEDVSQIPSYIGIQGSVQSAIQITTFTGVTYISPLLFTGENEPPFFLVGARIINAANEPLGIMLAAFPLDELQEIVASGNGIAGQGSYAILVDDNHLRVAHGVDPTVLFKLLTPPTENDYSEMINSMRIPPLPVEEVATDLSDFELGLQRFSVTPYFSTADSISSEDLNSVAVARLSSRPWLLAYLQPQSVILSPVADQTRVTIFLAAAVAGLSILAAVLLARLLADPIVNLTTIAQQAANGDLTKLAPATSSDEIGTLSVAFNSMINQLRLTLEGLETRVSERTAELAQTSEQMKYRASRLQLVAEVAHAITAVQEPSELLPRVTDEISTMFGFYHVGVFLMDKEEKFAVLQAANSEGGKRMLTRGHRLRIGEVGLVGFVADKGQARIALDVGQDAVFFDNPDLPDTRSEIALPLKVGQDVIGVLDVQSTEPGAFTQDDIALLSALADQVAMAIQNSRLFDETRRTLRELQVAQRQYLQQAWGQLVTERPTSAYEYMFGSVKPLVSIDEPSESVPDESPVIMGTAKVLADENGNMRIPIALRGQVIGQIDLQEAESGRIWSQEELDLAQAVADQVGLALENARLLEETQRRAERERLVADITTKMRAVNDPQTILETAVVELRNALRVKSVRVKLQPDVMNDDDHSNNDDIQGESTVEERGAA